MSNPNQFFQDLSFDPEEITAVNKAYELARQTLHYIGQPEVDRENHRSKNLSGRGERRTGRPQTFASVPSMD